MRRQRSHLVVLVEVVEEGSLGEGGEDLRRGTFAHGDILQAVHGGVQLWCKENKRDSAVRIERRNDDMTK
jgi:hypothetical protein